MRKVCKMGREVLDIAAREVRPGVTTDYIDEIVHKACLERNVSKLASLESFTLKTNMAGFLFSRLICAPH